jgi:hypothetical protein
VPVTKTALSFGRKEFVPALLEFFDGEHIIIGSSNIEPIAFEAVNRD